MLWWAPVVALTVAIALIGVSPRLAVGAPVSGAAVAVGTDHPNGIGALIPLMADASVTGVVAVEGSDHASGIPELVAQGPSVQESDSTELDPESSRRLDLLVFGLLAIAVVMSGLLMAYLWHTSPRHRLRVARRRARPSYVDPSMPPDTEQRFAHSPGVPGDPVDGDPAAHAAGAASRSFQDGVANGDPSGSGATRGADRGVSMVRRWWRSVVAAPSRLRR